MELLPLFDKKTKENIIDMAIEVLHRIGIECSHKKTVKELSTRVKIDYRDGRIHLFSDTVMEHLERKKAAKNHVNDAEFKLVGPWCSFEICDPATNDIRPATDRIEINFIIEGIEIMGKVNGLIKYLNQDEKDVKIK